jgi:glycosyltransferase involved in cell wall biosynthesis
VQLEPLKVSVIIPNYNHSQFLKKRLDSVFEQKFQDFEVILLDDFSSDKSQITIEKYKNHNKVTHCIFNKVNSGSPFSQWKKGIELAKGEYIWIAESDDFADSTFLTEMVCLLDQNPTAGLAYCQSHIVDEDSHILRDNYSWTDDLDVTRWRKQFKNKGLDEIQHFLSKKCTIPNASAVLIRKSAIQIKDIQTQFKKMGDWYLWISILKNHDVVYTPKLLNYFRDTSYSTRVLDTIPKLLNYYEEKIQILTYLAKVLPVKNTYVNSEKRQMIQEYISIVSIKSLINSKFYYKSLLLHDFIFTIALLFKKTDFKKLFFRKIITR